MDQLELDINTVGCQITGMEAKRLHGDRNF